MFVSPSLLAADHTKLQEEADGVAPFADWLHIDVMDNTFVPGESFLPEMLDGYDWSIPLDIHLMVSDPTKYIVDFGTREVEHISFHAEAVKDTVKRQEIITMIRDNGATVGIAINPETSISEIDDVADQVDAVLVMSVHPGKSGQAFLPEVVAKISELRALYPDLMIQVDGGINADTAKLCKQAGADNLVAGHFIFSASSYAEAISSLRSV